MSFNPKITQELKDTVASNEAIKNVYFDGSGRHYFTAHTLQTHPGEGIDSKELYGQGKLSHRQVIPGESNVDQIKEDIPYGQSSSKIVHSLSREEVLNYSTKEDKKSEDSSIFAQFARMSDQEKKMFAEMVSSSISRGDDKTEKEAKDAINSASQQTSGKPNPPASQGK